MNSVWIGRSYGLYLWIVGNYGDIDPALLHESGLVLGRGVVLLACHSLLLGGWSWSAGFVLGALSRRATLVNGILFCLMLVCGERLGAPRGYYYVAGAVFAKGFSSVMLPLILLLVLVLLPSVWGMYEGRRRFTLGLPVAIFWACAVSTLTALAPSALWWWNWPVVYILVTAGWRWRQRKTVTS
jgi:hypothetical protein